MKIAAIDIGSNSIHMVVVEMTGSGGFEVVEREKEMVRRGAGTLARGPARLVAARA
jgi:exopolyphosphatase/guanosine-5'-triphosphate,3'-diphosphate pyrophosphatase